MPWKLSLAVALAAIATLCWLRPAHAQTTPDFLTASGQEVNIGLTPGTLECIGGQPLNPPPNPFTLCSPETTKIYIRGQVEQSVYQNVTGAAADMFAGTLEAVDNCNLNGKMVGYCWGTFHWTIPGKGLWEGYWFGEGSLGTLNVRYTAVGYGRGDGLEGM
jgi:hypothetical protein